MNPTAGYLEIKKAYRALAKQYHPDRLQNPTEDDQSRFAAIAEAYHVLSDLKRRKAYDASLHQHQSRQDAPPPPPYNPFYQPHYSGYPYFQWDFVTPHLHAFFVGQNPNTAAPEERSQRVLFNYKTLIISILGALFFFKFFTSMEGVVTQKETKEKIFNNVSYILILKTEENETARKRVKPELYDRINVEDRIEKSMFSLTYRINDEEIPGPAIERIFLQIAMIYAVITGGLFLLERGRNRRGPQHEGGG